MYQIDIQESFFSVNMEACVCIFVYFIKLSRRAAFHNQPEDLGNEA